MKASETYDVAIVGAGPAGSTCALALHNSGLKTALIDKNSFPRDKVCGDAIPARCEKVLHAIDPLLAQRLREFHQKVDIKGCRIVAPNRAFFDFFFHTPGYCSERLHFDDFLLQLALDWSSVDLYDGYDLSGIEGEAGRWQLRSRDGVEIYCRALIGCDGAQSLVSRQLTERKMSKDHHCAAVRAYYENIADLDPGKMEIHFLQEHLPGYFWIFPLPDNRANVGFGMLSSRISERGVGLRQSLEEIVSQAPGLRERFASAVLHGPVTGFGLPLGSRKVEMSGAGFLLCGDAAALIEPATGEGIGNAMLSGRLAAEHIAAALKAGDLSAHRLKAYDQAVYAKIWKDLRRKYLAQKYLGDRPGMMNWLVNRAQKPGPVNWLMRKVF